MNRKSRYRRRKNRKISTRNQLRNGGYNSKKERQKMPTPYGNQNLNKRKKYIEIKNMKKKNKNRRELRRSERAKRGVKKEQGDKCPTPYGEKETIEYERIERNVEEGERRNE